MPLSKGEGGEGKHKTPIQCIKGFLILQRYTIQHGSHQPPVAAEHLQCASSELRHVVNVQYTLDFCRHSTKKKKCKKILMVFRIDCLLKSYFKY